VRPDIVVLLDPLIQRGCAASSVANTCPARNSARKLRWKRSILPVVVGERGAVNKCSMPFSRQIRSNSTSTGG
jgi:hypothetical protein